MNAELRQALKKAVDEARRQQMPLPEPGKIEFPATSNAQHGTTHAYRLGCKCDACRAAGSAARKANRQANMERERALGRVCWQRRKQRLREQAQREQAA